jgi:hypothetical protein
MFWAMVIEKDAVNQCSAGCYVWMNFLNEILCELVVSMDVEPSTREFLFWLSSEPVDQILALEIHLNRSYLLALMMAVKTALASRGGTALPTCCCWKPMLPIN